LNKYIELHQTNPTKVKNCESKINEPEKADNYSLLKEINHQKDQISRLKDGKLLYLSL